MNLRNELTGPEAERYREACNFTPDELRIFNLRVRDKSVVEISMKTNLSTATVTRRLKNIKAKMARI